AGLSRRPSFLLPAKARYFSAFPFRVEVTPPQCRLMDMGSRNGTYVNGRRVEDAVDLKDKDQIRAGRTVLRVSVDTTTQVEPPREAEPIPAVPVATPEAVPIPQAIPGLEEPGPVLPVEA